MTYNIFRVVADYPVGGKPSYGLQPNFYYLSKAQARFGNHIRIIARRQSSQPSIERDGELEIRRVDDPFNVNAYKAILELQEGTVDSLVHTHGTSGIFLAAFKRTLGLPLFSHVHGSSRSTHMPVKLKVPMGEEFSGSKMWYYYFRERLFWSAADRTLAVSNTLKNDLTTCYGIPSRNISVVYNGVDSSLFHHYSDPPIPKDLKKFEGKKIILYVGHFGPRKGLIYLIRAMSKIVQNVPDARAVCIGGVPSWLGKDDYWAFLRNAIRDLGLESKMLLLDRVPNDELPGYYSLASVFVLPSYYEAFAKVVLEAMSCATPVVVTREGGPQEAIEEGVSGRLVKYGSPNDLVTATTEVLQDERKARKMGEEGRKRIERDFTWDAVARRVNVAYDEVFARKIERSSITAPGGPARLA